MTLIYNTVDLDSTQLGNNFSNNEKNTWKFILKNAGKTMEKSWNFVSAERLKPSLFLAIINVFILSTDICCFRRDNGGLGRLRDGKLLGP